MKTLDLERFIAMYQRKPTTKQAPIMPEPVAGMIVVIDGRLTNARPQDGGDDHINPQRLWAFTVDDGSGGVAVLARKAQVLPLLTSMEAGTPVYIVARLRFVHEVESSTETVSLLLGLSRRPDDLVCEVIRAGESDGMGQRADDTPEAQDEERERQHAEQLSTISTDAMADVPAPSVATMQAKLQEQAGELNRKYGHILQQTGPGPVIKTADQLLDDQQRSVSALASEALQRSSTTAILLEAHRLGLKSKVTMMFEPSGATINTVCFYRDEQQVSEPLLVTEAARWLKGYRAAQSQK